MLRKFWDSQPPHPRLSTMLLIFNLHNAMTFNTDYEQSVQKENDQVLKGEVIIIFYFNIVDSPVPRILIFSSDNVNQDS